jgi:hypothetical protein
MLRDFIGDRISIDGRMIEYRLVTATNYLEAKGWTEEQINNLYEEKYEVVQTLNQIMALKQSCYLLRRTSYSCGSLSESLFQLKLRLIKELKDIYDFEFDDEFVERDGNSHIFSINRD